MSSYQHILDKLPYASPFLFVDELLHLTEDTVEGTHTFDKGAFFYRGHFKGHPVTPGVILTECMAQIGLVCLGIHLLSGEGMSLELQVAMSAAQVDYFLPVAPGEKVIVKSEKVYFRFNKLKCRVEMRRVTGELVCKGEISGMIISRS